MTRAPRNSRHFADAKTNVARLPLRRQIYALFDRHLQHGRARNIRDGNVAAPLKHLIAAQIAAEDAETSATETSRPH